MIYFDFFKYVKSFLDCWSCKPHLDSLKVFKDEFISRKWTIKFNFF